MKEKEQTSIDWIISQINLPRFWKPKNDFEWSAIFEQAKELHKKEIIEAYKEASIYTNCEQKGIKYYNEKYSTN